MVKGEAEEGGMAKDGEEDEVDQVNCKLSWA